MLPAFKLPPGRTLIIDGPAAIRLIDGEASCFGGLLVRNRWVLVKGERRVPIESSTGASLEVKTGEGSVTKEIQGSTIPGSWIEAGQIVRQVQGTIVVLGDVDSGKSSLSTYLANVCHSNNMTVRVIDADIGQADIGPPATVSGASLRDVIYSLQDLTPEACFFVGDTSPGVVPEKVSRGSIMVRSHLPGSEVLIVNTDGWIEGSEGLSYKLQLLEKLGPDIVLGLGSSFSSFPRPKTMYGPSFSKSWSLSYKLQLLEKLGPDIVLGLGSSFSSFPRPKTMSGPSFSKSWSLSYKLQLLEKLGPDIVLGLGNDEKLDPILDAQNRTVLKLGPSEYARARSREERKRAREAGYKKFLDGSRRRELRLDELLVRLFNNPGPLDISNVRPLRGILTGLVGSDGMLLGVSRLLSVRGRKMNLETKVQDIPSVVELGAVRLSPDYVESGYVHM